MFKKILIIAIFLALLFNNFSVGNEINNKKTTTGNNTQNVINNVFSDEDITRLQEEANKKGWSFTVGYNSATNRSLDELCGLVEPKNWREHAVFDNDLAPTPTLPEKWDWREQGGVTPVKDQGQCGSCWAFATVGPLESAIKIKTGQNVDLSEQWLVSCNRDGWGCDGGWWAHEYHAGLIGKCGGTGAVLEEYFPYVAYDQPCSGPYPHDYLLVDNDGDGYSWEFIGGEGSIPSVEKIKQAIYTYGPVSAAVYVDIAFQMYTGGVFNGDGDGQVNHAIVLVGWDDTKGKNGVWILRNSWGTGWGENGYMYIEYGCNRVGYAACYIDDYKDLGPDNTDVEVNLNMHRLTDDPSQGNFDPIEPPLNKPEWYYRVGLKSNGDLTYQYHYNKVQDPENPGTWWDYAHEYTWSIDQEHLFYTKQPTVEITIKVMEYDETIIFPDSDDLADVSQYPGGGEDDNIDDKRAAIYHGTYDLRTDTLSGDTISDEGLYKTTIGDGKNNAKVWFKITDSYIAENYKPKIDVKPDFLDFGEVSRGIYDESFKIYNIAQKDPLNWADKLEWTAETDRNWISLDKTTGSIPGSSSQTVTVTIDTTDMERGSSHRGNIIISSNDKQKTISLSVTIEKTRTRNSGDNNLLQHIFETILPDFYILYKNIIKNILEKIHYK